ncbi:22 member 18 [Seminavis robusta]|uniref:22 member 18 n=1 Tax=Seminavis robusta TaxID=568900 RepID=A0A9N8DVV4_9STRA|nr:22 member 18 [Seminavis robusta]|eukprot:Sro333_g119440.1 22 member 18 (440) ;mRNA; f:6678-7997
MATSASDTPSASGRNVDMVLWVTYINIVLYGLCFQLQRPVEPFLVKSLSEGSDSAEFTQTYGRLQSFFNAVQTIGSPLVGILLDQIGIRNASAVVFGATALSYAMLASATDMNLLFLSKVPTMLQAAFLVAQATAANVTGDDNAARARALGRMTTAYTIGATVGPALGGHLASMGDLYFSAKIAVVGSLISVVLSILFLPNSTNVKGDDDTEKKTKENEPKKSFLAAVQHSLEIAMRPAVWPLLTVKLVGGIVASMHGTALPITLTEKLQFEPSQLGISMSTSMFVIAAFGAFCMAPLARSVGPDGMASMGLVGRALMGPVFAAIVAFVSGNGQIVVMQVALASVLHALSSHCLATGLTTQTTGAVNKEEQGTLLGLEHCLFSLARIAGPTLGTTLLSWSKTGSLWYVEGACASADLLLNIFLFATTSSTRLGGKLKQN